jgi:hypothetical protein
MPLIEQQAQPQQPQPQVRASRTVSFAPETYGENDEALAAGVGTTSTLDTTTSSSAVETEMLAASPESVDSGIHQENDGTGKRFVVAFQEYRLRFDQTFPEGLDLRIPASEFEIVLEQIHRELVKPLDKSQKTVRKWSAIVAGTAPIGVGFVLSIVLARHVHRHQKAMKTFWISLRNFLKTINRDTYYSRGIEWRIERDLAKIEERDCYNKLYMFKIEIIFRKPITLRSGREVALRSIVDSKRSSISAAGSRTSSALTGQSRFSSASSEDAELFALLSTVPGSNHHYSFDSDGFEAQDNAVESTSNTEQSTSNTELYDGDEPLFVREEESLFDNDEIEDDSERLDRASLLISFPESDEVSQARANSIYEPPSPQPTSESIFTTESGVESEAKEEATVMTYADLLKSTNELESITEEEEEEGSDLIKSEPEPENLSTTLPESNENAFAKRQRKKFSRQPTLATQLYAIPESPNLLDADEDPAKDALAYLTADEGEEEDVFEEIAAGNSSSIVSGAHVKPVLAHFDDIGPVPVAAFPLADPFSPLYETDQVEPLNPSPPLASADQSPSVTEYTEVDGEGEFIRRKKWRVAPENAAKLSRVQTMSESIQPASRRSSYLPQSTRAVSDILSNSTSNADNIDSSFRESI